MATSQPKKNKSKKRIVKKIKDDYRLVILNEETFEERLSVQLSPLKVFAWGGTFIILLITFTVLVVSLTPLREYIPGYADVETKKNAIYAAFKVDSLESVVSNQRKYIENINAIIEGNPIERNLEDSSGSTSDYKTIEFEKSQHDSILQKMVEVEDSYNLSGELEKETISNIYFFPPLKGMVSSEFNVDEEHYGIDITAAKDEAIKTVLDGTVIFSSWTAETGYVIQVQHAFNLISTYKHNSRLLKEVGNKVKAGDAIAIVGNTGELTSGSHLHFELWHEGKPVNPIDFITF